MLHANITGKIINAFYKVNNTLGFGFLGRDLKPLKDEKYRFIPNGHAIGSGWTYLAEALRIGDRNLFRKGMDVLRWHFTKGWDFKYGGVIFIIPAQSC